MITISKRQRARSYIYKNQEKCETFLYSKSQTLNKNQENLRYVSYTKKQTLYVTQLS